MNKEDFNKPSLKILNIIKNGYQNDKDLLFLFSSYIASNPDFKYNTTYLTDSIDLFFSDFEIYSQKKLIYEEIIKYLNILNSSKFEVEIEFDSKFKYNTKSSTSLETLSNNNTHNETFDFHKIGARRFAMKLTLITSHNIEYTHMIDKDDKSKKWEELVSNFMKIAEKQNNEK
ncbi:hypothetical protein EMN47_17195 [Prolixibacteraceae bacterium JC049]|nr:hypothetical protein [Prolixibacteraceae bacterium JC049]